MLIEQTDLPTIAPEKSFGKTKTSNSYLKPIILGTFITLTVSTLPILFVISKSDKPTGTLISPIPDGVVSDSQGIVKPSFDQMISLAQNYLHKALELSRNPNEAERDQNSILLSLNQGLNKVNEALTNKPTDPEGILLREEIQMELAKINQPVEQVLIAAPNDTATDSAINTGSPSNANKNSFMLPAGSTELEIKDPLVNNDSYIYIIPGESQNNPIYIKSKSVGSFTVSPANPITADTVVYYYVINE